MDTTRVGIIGCGSISDAYLKGGARSDLVMVKAVSDLNAEAAKAKATAYDVEAMSVDRLLADEEIDIVINLTVPLAHAEVSHAIIAAGKHVYSEKPLAAVFADGQALMAAAETAGLRVGCAPDTFLGAGHQACRRAIDEGVIGEVVGGAATVLNHGMEHWHPNPTFFFKHGGGPVHDIGPYYITQLVNMIGPVSKVTSMASSAGPYRTVLSEGPMTGEKIEVEVPTSVNGVLSFANGANVAFSTSWDVWKTERMPIEIYGSQGSMLVPDPNFFGGEPMVSAEKQDWTPLDIGGFAYGVANRDTNDGKKVADYRIIGLLDMASALKTGRPHRASGQLGLHVLEVMDALLSASSEGRHVAIQSRIDRPAPLPGGEGEQVFA